MPAVPLAIFDLTVTRRIDDTGAGAVFILNVTQPDRTTAAVFLMELTSFLADAYASNVVQIGTLLELDFGAGWETIPLSERAVEISIGEHLDAFTDDCSITIAGDEYSPLYSALTRAKTPVRLTGYYGVAGAVTDRVLFEGFVSQGQWNTPPAAVTLNLLDNASLDSEKTVAINIVPGSLRTRKSIVEEIAAALSITLDEIILPNDGGLVVKAKSEGGTKRFPEYVNQILSPVGAQFACIGGRNIIKRFEPAATPDRILTTRDISGAISIDPPATGVANIITATGSTFDHAAIEASADSGAPEVTETVVYAPAFTFIPQQPVEVQDASGVLTPYVGGYGAILQETEISRVRTETTRTPERVTTVVTEWGWYLPRCAPIQQQLDGSIDYRHCFVYEDGSYSLEVIARYRIVREYISVDELTETGSQKTETTRSWGIRKRAIAVLDSSLMEVPYLTDMTAEGEGWVTTSEEYLETETVTTTVTADSEGLVTEQVTETERYTARPKPKVENALVYGPAGSVSYKASSPETMQMVERERVSYVPINRESYLVRTEIYTSDGGTQPRTDQSMTGSRPKLELANSKPPIGQSQLMTATFRNEVSIAMNGEIRGADGSLQNEECETPAELAFVAKEHARELGAIRGSFPMPWDLTIHKGKTIQLDIPPTRYGFEGKSLLVEDVERSLNLTTTENNQNVSFVYYPPELQ